MSDTRIDRDAAAREAVSSMSSLVLDGQRKREVSERTGVSFGKMRALRRIAGDPMSMRELAGLLGMDPPNLTTVVDDLERSGLVERQAHPTDGRIKLVVATARGEELARQADEILERAPVGLLELPDDDLAHLVRILRRVCGTGTGDEPK